MASKFHLDEEPFKQIPQLILNENLQNHYYSTVNIYHKGPKFSFVPASEYKYGIEQNVIRNSFDLSGEEVSVDLCGDENLHIVHAFDTNYYDVFRDLQNDVYFRHISLAFIQCIKQDGLYVQVTDKELILLVREKGRFLFYNQFQASTLEDYLYFTMLAIDQLQLDARSVNVILDGSKSIVSEFSSLLGKYVVNIRASEDGFLNLEDSTDIMDLYYAAICE